MYLILQLDFPSHLQTDNGLLTLYYLVEYVHLYVAIYDVYFDTEGTHVLNICDSLHIGVWNLDSSLSPTRVCNFFHSWQHENRVGFFQLLVFSFVAGVVPVMSDNLAQLRLSCPSIYCDQICKATQ